jgi:hypothetical protein
MIEAEADCYSACALVFMSGNVDYAGQHIQRRSLNIMGNLGFQAQYLNTSPPENQENLPQDTGQSYEEGIRALGRLLQLGKEYRLNLIEASVLTEVLQADPTEIFRIDTVFKAIVANIDLFADDGLTLQIDRTALCNACENFFGRYRFDIDDPPVKCTARTVKTARGMTWFGGFDPEGGGFCVAKKADDGLGVGVYSELAYRETQAFDRYKFVGSPWYALSPALRIGH